MGQSGIHILIVENKLRKTKSYYLFRRSTPENPFLEIHFLCITKPFAEFDKNELLINM